MSAVDLANGFNEGALGQALALLPAKLDTRAARVQLLAIGLQESGLTERVQKVTGGGTGPARGLLQFELGGGVRGVMTHPASRDLAAQVLTARRIGGATSSVVWGDLATDDVLAFAFGRLLLLTDPFELPVPGDCMAAWHYYERNWRPGHPRPESWGDHYITAMEAVPL